MPAPFLSPSGSRRDERTKNRGIRMITDNVQTPASKRLEAVNATSKIFASIEVASKQAIESQELPGLFPSGVRVYIPDVGADTSATLVKAAKRIVSLGYVPVPHFAARRITTKAALEDRIKALTQESGVRDVLVIGGDISKPAGEFGSSMDVLETGLLDKYGITDIGIAGHPEGSPDFPDEVALQALKLKASFRKRSNARLRIVTQFGFDPQVFVDWTEKLQTHGVDLPVHLGIAGPAKITTLIKFATMCGVGNSLSFLKKRAGSVATLMNGFSPEDMLDPIERHVLSSPASPIHQIHVFPFGGIKPAAVWLRERDTWGAKLQQTKAEPLGLTNR